MLGGFVVIQIGSRGSTLTSTTKHMARLFWRGSALFRPSVATLTTLGVLGTTYHTTGVAHADNNGALEENSAYLGVSQTTSRRRTAIEPFPFGKNRDVIWTHPQASAFSATVEGDTGIARIDSLTLSNKAWSEDFVALRSVSVSGLTKDALSTNWSLVSLTNGFSGSRISLELSKIINNAVLDGLTTNLHEYVKPNSETEFTDVETSPYPTEPYEEAVNRIIKSYFVAIDTAFTEDPLKEALSSGKKADAIRPQSVALSGCSAILSLYDSSAKQLRIALTGDSRALLGRPLKNKDGSKSYEVHVLTADQTIQPSSPHASVIAQAKLPHPVSRAFGVASLKWGREIQQRLHEEYLGDRPFLPTTTAEPPYITAEPVITSISIKPGDFLVLGSAGLWKSLTNEEIVGLLGVWVDRGMINADTNVVERLSSSELLNPRDLPVAGRSAKVVKGDSDDGTTMYRRWRTKKQFVCVDHNAGLHLARNALGGSDQDLTAALLSMSPPRAALFRDNISATVVFFDD